MFRLTQNKKQSYWYLSLFMVLVILFVSFLVACGSKNESYTAYTPIGTEESTSIPTASPTNVSTGPVKIGAITAWSGPLAAGGTAYGDPMIKLVEKQVKDSGGILDGRELQVIKYDDRASVADATAGATKLCLSDKVSALVWGGVSKAEGVAVSDFAEANKILYVPYFDIPNIVDRKYTVNASIPDSDVINIFSDFITKDLKPKTVGFLMRELDEHRTRVSQFKKIFSNAGINIVYEDYAAADATDFMPYLTKVKYANPEVLILDQMTEGYTTIAKQVVELGGLANMKILVGAAAAKAVGQAGAEGWYMRTSWWPEAPFPESTQFIADYQTLFNKMPESSHILYYDSLRTAIEAIKLAGTDSDLTKIADVARSGKLTWKTPLGTALFTTDGQSGLHYLMVHIENGKLVAVPSLQ